MTDDVLPDFGRSDDMVLPVFDRGALAVAEQEQQRQRGEPNLPAPAYPPSVDLGFGGPARSQMTFGENAAGSFFTNTLPGVIGEAASNEAARGNAQPGGFQPSQLRSLPSRVRQRIEAESPEDAAARREAAYRRVFDQAAYDLSQSRITPQSVAGTVVGALADPVNIVSLPANALRRGAAAVAGRFGAPAGRVAESAIDAAVTNTAIDPVLQAGRIQSGGQEGYNPEQTALAPLVGGAAGALLRGAIEAPSFARREAQAFGVDPARIETPQSVGTEATGVPAGTAGEARIATPEAPIAREGQALPDAGPVQRQTEAVSPEPARIEAPAREPVDRGAAVEATPAVRQDQPVVRAGAAPEPARVAANDAEPQQFAAMARNQDVRQIAREEIAAREDISPMARQTADTTADRRFPGRQELPGEASKPRSLPENIRPEDIRDFRVTELMRDIAARMDRKLEVDGRFSIRNAEGQYDFKQGVLRIRKEGDYEVFSHELGHAIEQQLRRDVGRPLDALLKAHAAELKRLDVNADDPADQTVREGFAEFVRRLINNPAYAAKQAPGFAPEFARLLESAPQIRDIINDATLISRIDGGLDPVQSIKSTIAPAVEPRGVAKFMDEWRRSNLPVTMGLWADRAYAATVDRGHWVKRFVQSLTEARFKKAGRPMSEFGWNDPTKMFRALDGAKQAAVDAFQNGVRDYGRALDGPSSPSLHAALKEAGGGSIGRMLDEQSEGYRDFNAYLIARRSLGEYERFRAGDLPSPPVRQTENEIVQAIAALEAANPTFRSAADKVFGFSRAMLRKKFEAGLVSKEFYDAVTARGMDYVPFFRDMMDGETRSGGGGSNGVQQGLEGQRFRGSTRDILDPIQSLMLDTARSERVIALNDFWTAMHRLAKQGGEFSGRFLEEIPNSKLKGVSIDVEEALKAKARERGLSPEDTQNLISSLEEMVGEDMTATLFKSQEISPGGERIVFRYDGGQRIAMKLGSDEYSRGLFEVMKGMSAAERDVMLAMFGKANAMFAQFITNAPQFALKNLVMDNLSRLFVARHTGILGRIPFASLAQGIYTHIFDREFSKAYAAMGGIRGGVVSAASRDLERTGGLEALSLTPQGTMGTLRDMVGNVQSPADALKAGAAAIGKGVEGYFKLIEATETAGRLGQARFVFNHLKKQGLDDYQAMHAAIYEARDVLDYDRRGTSMKVATRLMPFFNVGIQGIDRGLRNLVSDPLAAALQAYKRGGYANVDEAGKTALRDAVINWGMIVAAAVVTLGYHAAVSDDPVYRRQSDYMRKRYFILPMGQDASGRDFFISVPKPFDLPGGILSAVEAAADGIKRADPEAYGRVAKSLAEGFIPRQLAGFVEGPRSGVQDFLGAQPLPKVGFEAVTGKRLGFEGSQATDIIPMGLRGLMPADQWTGNTSFLAKRIGAATGGSPLMIDHIMNGLGATAARDFNDVMTATFDNNPNMTPQDAYTKLFFGGLYRGARGVGSDRSEVTQLMGRDGAKYMAPALSYAAAIERGDTTRSEQIYQNADSIGKALMTLRGHSFAPAERQLHPLQSAETWAATVGAITRDLSQNRIEVQNRSRRRGEQRETVDLEPGLARSIINTMNAMAAEEIRNGLSTAGIPGYQGLPVIDTKARLDAIRALNPQVADEIQNRITRAHIIPAEVLREKWPEVQRRLSSDRQLATLNDLLPAGASQAARRAAGRSLRTRQRVEESNNSD